MYNNHYLIIAFNWQNNKQASKIKTQTIKEFIF